MEQVKGDTVVLEELDFSPECVMDDSNLGEWEAILPCGHHQGLFCTDHWKAVVMFLSETWVCATCHESFRADTIIWVGYP